MEKCHQCGRHKVEYTSPDRMCFNCWTKWWVDGMKCRNKKEYDMELRKVRKELRKKR